MRCWTVRRSSPNACATWRRDCPRPWRCGTASQTVCCRGCRLVPPTGIEQSLESLTEVFAPGDIDRSRAGRRALPVGRLAQRRWPDRAPRSLPRDGPAASVPSAEPTEPRLPATAQRTSGAGTWGHRRRTAGHAPRVGLASAPTAHPRADDGIYGPHVCSRCHTPDRRRCCAAGSTCHTSRSRSGVITAIRQVVGAGLTGSSGIGILQMLAHRQETTCWTTHKPMAPFIKSADEPFFDRYRHVV